MSLLGNRGRFTRDENIFLKNINTDLKSALSSLGTNPMDLFKISHGEEKKPEFDVKERLKSADVENYKEEEISDHQRYNKRLHKYNFENENKYKAERTRQQVEKKKVSIKTIIAMIVVELVTIFAIYTVGSVYRYTNMTQSVPFNIKNVENKEIAESTLEIMKGYKTVAVFGVDSRTGSIDKGNNADVNLIINLNLETGDVQLISVYRDLYLSITDNNLYDKLNSAYRRGGPEQAVKALNKNFDLNIDSYFAFNWKAVADGIELLGGIDLDITRSEYKYMNAFIHETCIATGIDSKNPAAHYIKSAGMQHLDGVQAVAYGRLRLMDSDFQRVERQKKVIALCLEKAKQLDIPRLRLIIEAVLPQIAYAFDMNELISLLRIVRTINITESTGCPDVNNVVTMAMGGSGDCVVPLNLEKAVIKLHKILFNVDDYKTSASVKRYSNRITELRVKHAEENRIRESLEEEESAESANSESKTTTAPRRRASSSNTKKAVEASSESSVNVNNLPISNIEEYEEEPESDSNLPISNNRNNINESSITANQSNGPVSVPGGSGSVNNAPSSAPSGFQEYSAPGVPVNPTNNVNAPSGSPTGSPTGLPTGSPTGAPSGAPSGSPTGAPGGTNSQSGAVVVPGPPTGDYNQTTETTVVVPILTPS